MLPVILSAALLSPLASQAPRPPQAPPVEGFRWVVVSASQPVASATPNVARATPNVARKATSCLCSPACVCGCQEGEPCRCRVVPVQSAPVSIPAPVFQSVPMSYAMPAPSFGGWGGSFGGGGFSGGRSAGGC